MTIALLLLSTLTATWGFMALALAMTHPAPSQTSLIGQFLFCFVAAPVLAVGALLNWFLGG